jgi:glyceraldehyde-3-phosphate dehydrogenase (NADP+)
MYSPSSAPQGRQRPEKLHPRPHRLRAALGLDAKNPGIVLPQVDLDNAVEEAVTGALSFNGQRCTALKILFVHEDVVEAFLDKFQRKLAALKPGMPWEPGVALTPLPEPARSTTSTAWWPMPRQGRARAQRRRRAQPRLVLLPGLAVPGQPGNARVPRGAVRPAGAGGALPRPADRDRLRAGLDYGQQLSLFGNDPATIGSLVDTFANQVGRININAQCQRGPDTYPFNGRKNSAEGTLSVHDALRVFSIRTLVATASRRPTRR